MGTGSIARRVGRIVSGGFNSLVEAVENAAPEAVMAEAIREIDSAIDEVRAELGTEIANRHLASKRLMEENRKHEELSEKIEVALGESRDDLAEAAIAKQLDIEAQIPILENRVADCGEQEKELEGYVQALQAKKREMQEELDTYHSSRAECGCSGSASETCDVQPRTSVESKVDSAESAFDRVLHRQAGLRTSSGAVDAKSASQLAELEDLTRKNRIKERLAEAKANK